METDPNTQVDSDDDLPDMYDEIPESADISKVKKGDFVWAEFRKFYWPSLVRKVWTKERKVSLWYLDSPRKCFKVPFSKIHDFFDREFTRKVKEQFLGSPMKQKHDLVLERTHTFISRHFEGFIDDPGDFFDTSKQYLCSLQYKSEESTFDNLGTISVHNVENESINGSNEEEEIELWSDNDESEVLNMCSSLDDDDDAIDVETLDKIISCITKGRLNKYLLDIQAGKISSNLHNLFKDAMETRDYEILHSITSGIFVKDKDMPKLQKISMYLMDYYEKFVQGGKCEMLRYVTSVWLPEAIKKAMFLIKTGDTDVLFCDQNTVTTSAAKRQLFASNSENYACEKRKVNKNFAQKVNCKSTSNSRSPRKDIQKSRSPRKDIQKSRSPRKDIQKSRSPRKSTQNSISPRKSTKATGIRRSPRKKQGYIISNF